MHKQHWVGLLFAAVLFFGSAVVVLAAESTSDDSDTFSEFYEARRAAIEERRAGRLCGPLAARGISPLPAECSDDDDESDDEDDSSEDDEEDTEGGDSSEQDEDDDESDEAEEDEQDEQEDEEDGQEDEDEEDEEAEEDEADEQEDEEDEAEDDEGSDEEEGDNGGDAGEDNDTASSSVEHPLITEVLYDLANDDSQGSERGGDNEWVEIYNPTDTDVDLQNWSIGDGISNDVLTTESLILQAGAFLIITDATTTANFWDFTDVLVIYLDSSISGGLSNGGDSVILYDETDTMVDGVSYGDSTNAFSPSVPDVGAGSSITRTVPGTDTDTAADWSENETPTPGS